MDCLEAIRTRRCIRKYSKQPVEFEKLMAVCEAGSLAPSSGNLQNWFFITCREKSTLRGPLYEACLEQECLKSAQCAVIVCSDELQAERHYGLRGQRFYSVQNCAAAIQNMLLAAHCLGLGANWIGAFNEVKVRGIFQIPNHTGRPQAIITLGYPMEEPPEKRLRHIDDVTRFETYTMRYRDLHRVLRDISIEIAKQKEELQDRYGDSLNDLLQRAKDFLANTYKAAKDKTAETVKKDKKK